MNKTQIINLYCGPGGGKSTSASYLYYLLKSQGANVELVREYVKDWAWEARKINTYDQIYFLGKQTRRESMLYGKVDYIVTDSPVMMGSYYADKYCPKLLADGIRAATKAFYDQAEQDGHKHHHVFLKRSKPYNPSGRYQSEEEAKGMDVELREHMMGYKLIECATDEMALTTLLATLQ